MSLSSFKIAHKLITGAGAIEQLAAELTRLDIDNPLIVTDAALVKSGTVELALAQLGERSYEIFDRVLPDPEIAIVEDCMRVYREGGHDGLIGLGGGSAIDIAKSVAAYAGYHGALEDLFGIDQVPRKGPPLIAIPTTAGTGSEVTNVAILSDKVAQLKMGIISDYLLPDVALVSPQMTLTCPRSVTAASGVDALVHAIESYLSLNASPITDALAIGAIKLITKGAAQGLRQSRPPASPRRHGHRQPDGRHGVRQCRGRCGACVGVSAGWAFQHCPWCQQCLAAAVCHDTEQDGLRGTHAGYCRGHGVKTAHLSASEAADKAVEAMTELCAAVEIPRGLRSFGVPEEAIPAMAVEAAGTERLMRNNPRKLSATDIEKIYRAAY